MTLSVDEYIDFCASSIGPFAADGVPPGITNGQFVAVLGNFHMLFSEVNPPPEIADWHQVNLDIWMAMREAISRQPPGQPLNLIVLLEVVFENFERFASVEISPELMARIEAAGCTGNFVDADEEPEAMQTTDETAGVAATSPEVLAQVEAYSAGCAGLAEQSSGPPEGATYGQTSEGVALIIGMLNTLMPPELLVDWHNAQVALFEGVKKIADSEPPDDTLVESKMFALITEFQALEAARVNLPDDVQAILVDAACIAQ